MHTTVSNAAASTDLATNADGSNHEGRKGHTDRRHVLRRLGALAGGSVTLSSLGASTALTTAASLGGWSKAYADHVLSYTRGSNLPAVGQVVYASGDIEIRGLENVIRVYQPGEKVYPYDRITVARAPLSGMVLDFLPQTEILVGSGGSLLLEFYNDVDRNDSGPTRWPQLQLGFGRYEIRMRRSSEQIDNLSNRLRLVTSHSALVLYTARAAIDVDLNQTRVAMLDSIESESNIRDNLRAFDQHNVGELSIDGTVVEKSPLSQAGKEPQTPSYAHNGWVATGASSYQPLISASTRMGDTWLSIPGHTVTLQSNRVPLAPNLIDDAAYRAVAERFRHLDNAIPL